MRTENESKGTKYVHVKDFKMLEFDPTTEEFSSSYVSLPDDGLGERGYKNYVKNNGNQVLVSDFGLDEYCCSFCCYCDVDSERRNVGTVASTGQRLFTYLVAAASSAVAFKVAQDYFDDYCQQELGDDCPTHAVMSGCGSCGSCNVNLGDVEEDYKGPLKKAEYTCSGHCLPNSLVIKSSAGWKSKDADTLKIKETLRGPDQSRKMIFQKMAMCEDLKISGVHVEIEVPAKFDVGLMQHEAKRLFRAERLERLCVEYSVFNSKDHELMRSCKLQMTSSDVDKYWSRIFAPEDFSYVWCVSAEPADERKLCDDKFDNIQCKPKPSLNVV